MSDRLKDLQRQRALAQEQLAWIDAEISKESGQPLATAKPAVSPAVAPVTPSAAEAARMAEEIMARYQGVGATSPAEVKRGCYLYFAAAFVLLGLGVVALYFYSAGRH